MRKFMLAAGAALLLSSAVQAAPARSAAEPQASIPFVNHNGIRDWHAADDRTLYVQDSRRNWYRASLMGPCSDLPYALGIGFETRGIDRLDRFSSIRVGRDRCPIESLTRSAPPPAKAKRG